jgi:hypothetical protein
MLLLLFFCINLLSVVWIVTAFNLARYTSSSAVESIASAAAVSGFVFPGTVVMNDLQEFVRGSILVRHDWNQLISFLFPISIQLGPFHWPSPSIP